MTMPFFSIVVPVYNRATLLAETIRTILLQSFTTFELIIVDDGSTDQTTDMCKDLMRSDPRIRYIFQTNSERGVARNNGFRQSAGKYVVFFDSDDRMHEDHLSTLYASIAKHNEPDFIATKFDFCNEKGEYHSSDLKPLLEGEYDYKLFLNGNPLACNICVKRRQDNLSLFVEDRYLAIKEDWLFHLQNLKEKKLILIDQVTITLYDHSGRSMRGDNKILISKTLLAGKWIHEQLPLNEAEFKILDAHINYFCAIHSYLDNNRKSGLNYLSKAINRTGLRTKYLLLLVKILVGRKLILKLQ